MQAVTPRAVQEGSARCKSCHAAIWFGLTAKGKRMPLDPAPVEDGNVVIDRDGEVLASLADLTLLPRVRVLRKGEAVDDVPRYVAHFVTCPTAERHRREDRKRNGSRAKARAMGLEAAG